MKNLHTLYAFISSMMLFPSLRSNAQNSVFLSHGRIEYECKVNVWAQLDDNEWISEDESAKALFRKMYPQFKSTYFNLDFNGDKTLFQPGRENPANNKIWIEPGETNTIFNDLAKSLTIGQKNVYEEKFLVQDSIRKIQWKITDETRNIAGFECRRANAIIMDSIYVVAFYTDAIVTAGGPESFTGLPGMILGIALPHEHITWFATKVYAEDVTDLNLIPPTKGKKVNNVALLKTLRDEMPTWDKKQANRQIRRIMI